MEMNKKCLLVYLTILSLILVSGCLETPGKLSNESGNGDKLTTDVSTSGNDILYQVSTIDALLQ